MNWQLIVKYISRIFLAISLLCVINGHAQPIDSDDKLNVYMDMGLNYIPYDELTGPVIGLGIKHHKSGFTFFYRKHLNFYTGYSTTNAFHRFGNFPTYKFQILNFYISNNFELSYPMFSTRKKPLWIGIGYGWLYNDTRKRREERYSGYSIIFSSIRYKIDWLFFGISGGYPIPPKGFYRYYERTNILFPISFSLIYRFNPRLKSKNLG